MKSSLIVVFAVTVLSNVYAQDDSPVGLWKTIDDNTGKPKACLRITETNGEFRGQD